MNRFWSRVCQIWGLTGVILLLVFAVYRLTVITLDAFNYAFDWRHWTLLIANIGFMAYSEGYRGFQRSFSPKVVSRAQSLRAQSVVDAPGALRLLLAPLYCMHYFDTTTRQLISTYLLTAMIVLLIIVFHQLNQPWRGILDAGVVIGLSWGCLSIILLAIKDQRSLQVLSSA